MYERSAIVLERYFENLLGYRREGNLRDNFQNYFDLVEKLEKYQINYEKELSATEEFEESLNKIRVVQASQKKLYEKSIKLEYNRNLLFNNIEAKVEDTRRCIEKIEEDIEQNNKEMNEIKDRLIEALTIYNEKRFELSKCKRYKKMAEKAYNDAYEIAVVNYDSITIDAIETAKEFAKFEDAENIISELEYNGKNEKIPFNEDVMKNATIFAIDIAKKEALSYLVLFDKMTKLLADIEEGSTKIELHKKYARNEKAKIDFIYAVKDYITQFLDYERMTVIHGRKSHNRLMSEACENFAEDIVQINNLFELLVKEIANKSTKKAYKELYNKNYLLGIQEKDEKFKKEKNRVNLNTATLINSNYWRIEGIKEIFTMFYKTVTEVLGKNVDEFDVLKTSDLEKQENILTEDVDIDSSEESEEVVEKIPFEIEQPSKRRSRKLAEANLEEKNARKTKKILIEDFEDEDEEEFETDEEIEEEEEPITYSRSKAKFVMDEYEEDDEDNEDEDEEDDYNYDDDDYNTADDMIDNLVQNFQTDEDEEEFDIFGEKYKDIDFSETINIKANKTSRENTTKEIEDSIYEEDEEDLFTDIKPVKKQRKNAKNEIEEMEIEDTTPKTILKKVRKISKTKKNTAESDVW